MTSEQAGALDAISRKGFVDAESAGELINFSLLTVNSPITTPTKERAGTGKSSSKAASLSST